MMALLVKNNADINVVDNHGNAAIELAKRQGVDLIALQNNS